MTINNKTEAMITNTATAEPVALDLSSAIVWKRTLEETKDGRPARTQSVQLKMPTLDELLGSCFPERRHLLFPWLREQESCMVYADTGVGKSLFALSAALAIAGGGSFLGWHPEKAHDEDGWKVLYIDGEMHIGDVQERAKMLMGAIRELDKAKAGRNLRYLARQHQEPGAAFPLITDPDGMAFVQRMVKELGLDLVILDNFSTLGEVDDENSASSFNRIQEFLLGLKTAGVATLLVHHAGKSGDFRGSSKLAATFETIIKLERLEVPAPLSEAQFRVVWDKVRAGGPKKQVQPVFAKLSTLPPSMFGGDEETVWEFEAAELSRLEDIRERLSKGEFRFLREIGDVYGVSKQMASKYAEKAKRLGLWTAEQERMWLAKGKKFRTEGKTQAPMSWAGEAEEEPEEAQEGAFEADQSSEHPDF